MHPLAEKIKATKGLKIAPLDLPNWGEDGEPLRVWVRNMRSRDRDRFESSLVVVDENADIENIRAKVAVLCLCDEEGTILFSEADADWLGEKDAESLNAIYELAGRLTNLSKKAIEAQAKNSDAAPSG